MLRLIPTLFFWLTFMGSGILFQIILLIHLLFVRTTQQHHRLAQQYRLRWSAANLRLFFGAGSLSSLRSASKELPEQFILVSNHRSNLDPLLVFVVGRPLVFLAKKSVLKTPVIGWWMKLCGDVPVDRGEKTSREQSLALMKERLQTGDSLLIYPEGTRQTDPNVPLGPFKDGAFHLAAQSGVPIVLLVLNRTDRVWEKGSLMLNLIPLRWRISQPLASQGRSADELKAQSIEKMLEMVQSLSNP
ncbi:1-acyl-sn-glycerol-3-phosphate acyltransferase [bacterium]|nr:1-acyl-sn-glycerol-3-phosphate acyltransferase [bacterium]